jgi:hypothetical protein
MPEQPNEHAADNSPEQVAYRLLLHVADLENKTLHGNPSQDRTIADRKWMLDTYAECLRAVRTPHDRAG